MSKVRARGKESGQGELGGSRRTMETMVWLECVLSRLG